MQSVKRILIVDDEEDFREIMAKKLRRRGIHADTAEGCSRALSKFAVEPYDAVIMDVSMPEIDGIQCLGLIKEKWPLSEVIILTGHASVASGIEGMTKGAFDYCLKPIELDELIEKLELACEKAKINIELSGQS